ncbi:hypothetical protein LDENG_00173450 [Lucifuga dentata]|nr:hypothetical protein LDENG_00173450 [Lucifuga dentata]
MNKLTIHTYIHTHTHISLWKLRKTACVNPELCLAVLCTDTNLCTTRILFTLSRSHPLSFSEIMRRKNYHGKEKDKLATACFSVCIWPRFSVGPDWWQPAAEAKRRPLMKAYRLLKRLTLRGIPIQRSFKDGGLSLSAASGRTAADRSSAHSTVQRKKRCCFIFKYSSESTLTDQQHHQVKPRLRPFDRFPRLIIVQT